MDKKISLLDCTLRDGCYIVDAEFGEPVIKGIIRKIVRSIYKGVLVDLGFYWRLDFYLILVKGLCLLMILIKIKL